MPSQKEAVWTQRHSQRNNGLKTQGEDGHLQAKECLKLPEVDRGLGQGPPRGPPGEPTCCWSCASGLPNPEMVHFCCSTTQFVVVCSGGPGTQIQTCTRFPDVDTEAHLARDWQGWGLLKGSWLHSWAPFPLPETQSHRAGPAQEDRGPSKAGSARPALVVRGQTEVSGAELSISQTPFTGVKPSV